MPIRSPGLHYGWPITPFSPHWTVTVEDGRVRCSAGSDRTHLLSELSPPVVDAVTAWVSRGGVPSDVDPEAAEIVEFFVISGILETDRRCRPIPWTEVGSTGVEFGPIVAPLAAATIVVRTNGSLADLAAACATANRTHLVVDLCAEHTLSVGPLAHVGFTACGGCYAARLIQRWGDPQPPPRPRLAEYADLAARLVQFQVDQPSRSGLVNATISFDLEQGQTQHHRLLRSPACVVCGPDGIATDGRLDLDR